MIDGARNDQKYLPDFTVDLIFAKRVKSEIDQNNNDASWNNIMERNEFNRKLRNEVNNYS